MNTAVEKLRNSYNFEIKPAIEAAKGYSGKSFIKDNLKFKFDPVSGEAKKEMNAVRKVYKGITSPVVDLDSSISQKLNLAGVPQGNSTPSHPLGWLFFLFNLLTVVALHSSQCHFDAFPSIQRLAFQK